MTANRSSMPGPCDKDNQIAAKAFNLCYHNPEPTLFTIYPYYVNLKRMPSLGPLAAKPRTLAVELYPLGVLLRSTLNVAPHFKWKLVGEHLEHDLRGLVSLGATDNV